MKKHYSLITLMAIILGISSTLFSQNVSINLSGTPSASTTAILDLSDVSNGQLGMLLPNVSLSAFNSITPFAATPTTGLIVWNTNAAMAGGFGTGFYYYNGSQWNYLYNSGNPTGNYVNNSTVLQAGANFNIGANGLVGGTFGVTGLSTLGAVTSVGIASINGSGANATTIGNGTNTLTENGNFNLNNNNGAATTNIGTGSTTGNISIGGTGNTLLLPKFTTVGTLPYISTISGAVSGLVPTTNGFVLTLAGGVPTWAAAAGSITGSGTTNYHARWTTATNLGIGVIQDNGTKAGVSGAVIAPASLFDVNGNVTIGSYAGTNAAPTNGLIVSGQVGVGTNAPNVSAALDVTSTTTGFLPPRMTAVQMNAIATPATGLVVLNTTTNCLEYYTSTVWQNIVCPCTGPPATPGIISGTATPCASSAGNVYTIVAVPSATSYNWTVPAGATITAGAGTTSITVTFGVSSGNITVTATNSCGTSAASTLAITIANIPSAPSVPSGTTTPGTNTTNAYTIPLVAGATTYTWSTSNTNLATITAGQGTTSVNVTTTLTAGTFTLCVTAGNACGTSPSSCLTITSSACVVVHGTATFNYTNGTQSWTVPCGISVITITLYGAQGGISSPCSGYSATLPATGGTVVGTLNVVPATTYSIYVGGGGAKGITTGPAVGGFNGGGAGAFYSGAYGGGAGGGASDIRSAPYALANRIAVAGGGGGMAYNYGCGTENGGRGGAATGEGGYENNVMNGSGYPGAGGTGGAGGAGGVYPGYCNGSPGALGLGGAGGTCTNSGGGGGAGYYGGGGGVWGGGGGGSNYTGGLTSVTTNNMGGGANGVTVAGNGQVLIQY